MKTHLKNNRGFTLIEVMVAMSILLIGILGIAGLQYRVVRNVTRGNLITTTNMVAQETMEQLKSTASVSSLTNGADVFMVVDGYGNAVTNFNRTWIITNPSGGNSRFITVTVTGNSGMGQRTVTIQSLSQGNGI